MATATKASLEARIAELESQLAAQPADPKAAGMTRLVGMLKAVKDITRPDGKRTVCAILTNSALERRGAQELRVSLPVDAIIATDNGVPIASEVLSIANSTEWARVAISGYWTTFGEIDATSGYPVCQRRQLRAQRIEVLNSAPAAELPIEEPFGQDPTLDEVPF